MDNVSWEEITSTREQLRDQYWDYWLSENVFSYQWWIMIAVNAGCILLWRFYVDRSRLFEVLTAGFLVVVITTVLDTLLIQYVVTSYPISPTPLSPSFFVSTYVVLPVLFMWIYQRYSTWKQYLPVLLAASFVSAYIGEGLLRILHIYEYIHWKAFYSVLVFTAIGVTVKLTMMGWRAFEKY